MLCDLEEEEEEEEDGIMPPPAPEVLAAVAPAADAAAPADDASASADDAALTERLYPPPRCRSFGGARWEVRFVLVT